MAHEKPPKPYWSSARVLSHAAIIAGILGGVGGFVMAVPYLWDFNKHNVAVWDAPAAISQLKSDIVIGFSNGAASDESIRQEVRANHADNTREFSQLRELIKNERQETWSGNFSLNTRTNISTQ